MLDIDIVACFVHIFLQRHPGCTPLRDFHAARKIRYRQAGGPQHEELAKKLYLSILFGSGDSGAVDKEWTATTGCEVPQAVRDLR